METEKNGRQRTSVYNANGLCVESATPTAILSPHLTVMKHLLPFLGGLVTFMVISSVFYMGIMPYPTSSCVVPEDQMNIGAMILGNALMVGLAAYLVLLGGDYSMGSGAKHGAIAGLTVNGMLNIFIFSFFTCDGGHIFSMGEAVVDIVANIVFMAATGATIAKLYGRSATPA